MYSDYEIRQIPLSVGANRLMVERFLAQSQLRLDDVDYYAGVFSADGDELLAGGGLLGDVIKCIAVDNNLRSEGLAARLVSHLISTAATHGHQSVKVFTKPENRHIFTEMGFRLLAETPAAVFLENGRGLEVYCQHLREFRHEGKTGVIVMNANPFTLGHRYLVEQALRQVDHVYVIAVEENRSLFSSEERLSMIRAGLSDLPNVTVCPGSAYSISQATFPTYFLKELSTAADVQMALDLNLFARHIATALGATTRFVGTEPDDPLTARYNMLMQELLPVQGIAVVEIPRLGGDNPISASRLRQFLAKGSLKNAAQLVPSTTIPHLLAYLAIQAMKVELDLTPKPGLVDRQDNGAHTDMDHAVMMASINALHPYLLQLAHLGHNETMPDVTCMQRIGLEAESAMFQATHGVNTHRGALFSLGLTIVAAAHLHATSQGIDTDSLQTAIANVAKHFPRPENTHGEKVHQQYQVGSALDHAMNGYPRLFGEWLPYYNFHSNDEQGLHKTLLVIMSTLDDTNVYHRCGEAMAHDVKRKASLLLNDFSLNAMADMNRAFIDSNLSPGGSADMLALTVFIHSITN